MGNLHTHQGVVHHGYLVLQLLDLMVHDLETTFHVLDHLLYDCM